MSSYLGKAVNPRTNEVEVAWFLDDYYGPHRYGVEFADKRVYPIEDVKMTLETK